MVRNKQNAQRGSWKEEIRHPLRPDTDLLNALVE